jgi:phage terminase small subunit
VLPVEEKLNMRQRKFAEYYVQSGNIVQSALSAGYSESYANSRAYELLENVGVSEYIKELTDKSKDESILTAKDRQAILSDIAKDQNKEPSDRIRAIDVLNKMTGEYLNKIEVNGTLETEKSKLDSLIEQMSGNE